MTEENMTQQGNITGRPPKAKEEAIEKLLESTGFEITSENGQRKYAAPKDSVGPAPPRGSEVFVGKLPRDVFEDELVPLFEKIGPVYEMRLMMDDGTSNRGYAFVMYTCPDHAKKAVEELNNYEIRKARRIGVCKSVDNCRLFVGGIPKTKNKDEILEEIRKVTDYVSKVILYSSIADKTKNRGFAFVEYESHKAAAMARRKLIPGKIPLFGHDIAVDWAEPEPEVDEEIMAKVTILYVRNLMMSTTEEKLKEVFSFDGELKVDKVKKLRDFAFVHYRNREEAEEALTKLNETDIDGSCVEVTWAKPADRVMRLRCHSRPVQTMPMAPFLYGPPAYDPYTGAIPMANCPGRGGMVPRIPFRGRGRGAAGIRRFRNFSTNQNFNGSFKSSEGGISNHSSYAHYPGNKHGKMPEKEQFEGGYYLMPLPPNVEGLESGIAVPGAPILPRGAHAHVPPPGFLFHPSGFEDVPYYVPYIPANQGY